MYYRYEAISPSGKVMGICQIMNPSERRLLGRYIKEPSWYKTHDTPSTCWLTEEGFTKYGKVFEEIISEMPNRRYCEIRCVSCEDVGEIYMKGRIQVIADSSQKAGIVRCWERIPASSRPCEPPF